MVEHIVALDQRGIVDGPEDLDLARDLAADLVVVGAVDDFEGVDAGSRAVEDLVDGAAVAGADSGEAVEVGDGDRGVDGRGERERDRAGELAGREREPEIGAAALVARRGGGGGGCGGGWGWNRSHDSVSWGELGSRED